MDPETSAPRRSHTCTGFATLVRQKGSPTLSRHDGQLGIPLRDLGLAFRFVWRYGRFLLIALWLSQLVTTVAPSGAALISGLAINSLAEVARVDSSPAPIGNALLYLWLGTGLMILVSGLQQASMYLEEVLRESVGISAREELLGKATARPRANHAARRPGCLSR